MATYIVETWHDYPGQTDRHFICPISVTVPDRLSVTVPDRLDTVTMLREACIQRAGRLQATSESNQTGIARIRRVENGRVSTERGASFFWRWTLNGNGTIEAVVAGAEVGRLGLNQSEFLHEEEARLEAADIFDESSYHGFLNGELVEYRPSTSAGINTARQGAQGHVDHSVARDPDMFLGIRWIPSDRAGSQEDGGYLPREFVSLCPRR